METKYFNISEEENNIVHAVIACSDYGGFIKMAKKAIGEHMDLEVDKIHIDENDFIGRISGCEIHYFMVDGKLDGDFFKQRLRIVRTTLHRPKKPKRYFLFGQSPSNEYYSRNKVEDVDADYGFDGVLHVFDPNTDDIGQLLVDYDGWGGYAELSKEEYDHLESKLEPKEVPVMGAFDENGDLI